MLVEWTKSLIVTIPKHGDLRDCNNYRTIAQLSHMGKAVVPKL